MKDIKEEFKFDGSEILELGQEYLEKSVKVEATLTNKTKVKIPVEEVGSKYVTLLLDGINLEEGDTVRVQYKVENTIVKFFSNEKLNNNTQRIEKLEALVQELLVANRNRVDINTFNTFVRLVERKTGISMAEFDYSSPYPKP